jgi:hypothetical protein
MSPQPKRPNGAHSGDNAAHSPANGRGANIPGGDQQPAPDTEADSVQQGDRDYGGQDAGADPVAPGAAKFGPADGYPDDGVIDLPHESGDPDPDPLTYEDLGPGKKYVAGESEAAIVAELAGSKPRKET